MVEYGLVGKGLSHSFSADFFNEKFRREGINARYSLFSLDSLAEFPSLLSRLNLRGINVTSPYKREIIQFLDRLTPEAEAIQAVNTVTIKPDGEGRAILWGDNTDWSGFARTLSGIKPSKALILGSGGAASAVAFALEKSGFETKMVSRTPEGDCIGYNQCNCILPDCHLVVNATPLGMHPFEEGCAPIDFNNVTDRHIFYDLIYNPSMTVFLRRARQKGAQIFNGLQMLYNQAEDSWNSWQLNN